MKTKHLLDSCEIRLTIEEITYSIAYLEKSTPSVYFLVHQGEIVYIGESFKPLNRMLSHKNEGVKEFDSVYIKLLPKHIRLAEQKEYESKCMTYYGKFTKYNVAYRLNGSADVNPLANLAL